MASRARWTVRRFILSPSRRGPSPGPDRRRVAAAASSACARGQVRERAEAVWPVDSDAAIVGRRTLMSGTRSARLSETRQAPWSWRLRRREFDERGDPDAGDERRWSSHGTRTGAAERTGVVVDGHARAFSSRTVGCVCVAARRDARSGGGQAAHRSRSRTRARTSAGALAGDRPAGDPQSQRRPRSSALGRRHRSGQAQLPAAAHQREHGEPAGRPGPAGSAAAVVALIAEVRGRPSARASTEPGDAHRVGPSPRSTRTVRVRIPLRCVHRPAWSISTTRLVDRCGPSAPRRARGPSRWNSRGARTAGSRRLSAPSIGMVGAVVDHAHDAVGPGAGDQPSGGARTARSDVSRCRRAAARAGEVHTGWSAGSAMPSSPLLAQYGEPGPE